MKNPLRRITERREAPGFVWDALVDSSRRSTVIQKNIRLPKELEATPEGEEIWNRLFSETTGLWSGSSNQVPVVAVHQRLHEALFYARTAGHVLRSYEQIALELKRGKRGLESLQKKTGQAASNRVSRMVFVTRDGSDRLYRRCGELLDRYGNLILLCQLDILSDELGGILYGKPENVKVIMITHKRSIIHVLRSLLPARSLGARTD